MVISYPSVATLLKGLLLVLFAATVSVFASACSTGESGSPLLPGTEPGAEISAGDPALLGPLQDLPPDGRLVRGDSFTLVAPSAFQQSSRPGPEGIPMLVLERPSTSGRGIVEVGAFGFDRQVGAVQSTDGLVHELRTIRGLEDVSRVSLDWPGASDSVMVQWTEPAASTGGDVVEQWAQLSVDLDGDRGVTVIAVAPAEEFETSGVLDVLRTLDVETGD